jgi:hypothetical protein
MPARRTVSEWTTLFELEPMLRWIFVEGDSNYRLLGSFFRHYSAPNITLAKASDLEIPSRLITRTPFCSGNKARLISFAVQVEKCLTRPVDNLRCIVDQDCATVVAGGNLPKFVCGTDFANFQIHFVEFDKIRHMVGAVYGHALAVKAFDAIIDATQFLFASRIDRYEHYPSAKPVDPYPSLMFDGGLSFDTSNYIWRFALRNGLVSDAEKMLLRILALKGGFRADPRNYMNFHDFLALLYGGLLRMKMLPQGVNDTELLRVFSATIDADRVRAVPLIAQLLTWAGL